MADIFDINTPKIDTITIVNKIGNLKHEVEKHEFYSRSGSNITRLKKWSNFTSWQFTVYKTTETDVAWTAIVASLEALNTGEPMDCEIDTINNSGTKYLCMFDCYYDKVSDFPVRKIVCNLYRVYSDGNEAIPMPEIENLLHYFKYNTDGDIDDYIGTLGGTNNNATFDASGKRGGCYSFNGTNANIGYNGLLNTNYKTIRMWVKTSGALDSTAPIIYNDTSNFWYAVGGKLNTKGGGLGKRFVIDNYNNGAWNHIVVLYDTSIKSSKAYINGIELISSTSSAGGVTGNLKIGSRTDGLQLFTGELDEMAVWNVELTEAQILQDYNSGTGKFL